MAKLKIEMTKTQRTISEYDVALEEGHNVWDAVREIEKLVQSENNGTGIHLNLLDYHLTPNEIIEQDKRHAEEDRKESIVDSWNESFDGSTQWSAGYEEELAKGGGDVAIHGDVMLVYENYYEDSTSCEVYTDPTYRDIMEFSNKHVDSNTMDHIFLEGWEITQARTPSGGKSCRLYYGS